MGIKEEGAMITNRNVRRERAKRRRWKTEDKRSIKERLG